MCFPNSLLFFNSRLKRQQYNGAIFADRDGTLIKHIDYIDDPDKVILLPGVKEAVRKLLERKMLFFILTNQSGVGRGYFSRDRVYACQSKLFDQLDCRPEELAGWCIATEVPWNKGGYRKPSPRYIEEAAKYFKFPPEDAHMLGDSMVDLETAWASGAKGWAVGCGKPELPEAHALGQIDGQYRFAEDFPSCVESILKQSHSDS